MHVKSKSTWSQKGPSTSSVHFWPAYSQWCRQVHVQKAKRNLFFWQSYGRSKTGNFCQGGSGKWFILRELPHPTRAIWRKFVSMTLRRNTCWRHVLIAECRTTAKGKVKSGLHCVRAMFSWFSPHTRLQYLKISLSCASFLYRNVKGTKHTINADWAKTGSFGAHRWRTAGIDGVVPVVSLIPSRTKKKRTAFWQKSGLVRQRWKL